MSLFDYSHAFSRNIGWVTEAEQQSLRSKRIAIGGMGGVGGSHLLTLTRLGVGNFHIADFDRFELANFNRQAGATVKNLDSPKVEVMAEAALDINPQLNITRFSNGITPENINEFMEGVDLYVDGLDFFAVAARRMVFDACTQRSIPAITAAPLGMGTALLNFLPGKMTFEEYFRLEGLPENEQLLNFLVGLSPAMLQRTYLADPSTVDFYQHRGPSTPMACELCAGVAATEALKILLNRGGVRSAPHGLQFDAYRNKLAHTWRPGGNGNPIQRLTIAFAKRQFAKMAQPPPQQEAAPQTDIEKILDLARWAPSGDNTQPWRFEIADNQHIIVHGFDTREHCVYDLDGHASQIALGALLENIAIAATGYGLHAQINRRTETTETKPIFDVHLISDPKVKPDPLIPHIPVRSVQRRAMNIRPLTAQEKQALEAATGSAHHILWLEGWPKKWATARLLWKNAKLRLTMPEAYQVHKAVIDWNARYSEDKVPDQAVGLDPITTRIMHWVMHSWARVRFFNAFLGGTIAPRIELDLIPALACAAHFVILARKEPLNIDDYVTAGRAVQRFWLTATQLGLQMQPEMTPLIFSRYAKTDTHFSQESRKLKAAQHIRTEFENQLLTSSAENAIFMGRIGSGSAAWARSLRLPLCRLHHAGQSHKSAQPGVSTNFTPDTSAAPTSTSPPVRTHEN